jgi:hypothetical protein
VGNNSNLVLNGSGNVGYTGENSNLWLHGSYNTGVVATASTLYDIQNAFDGSVYTNHGSMAPGTYVYYEAYGAMGYVADGAAW